MSVSLISRLTSYIAYAAAGVAVGGDAYVKGKQLYTSIREAGDKVYGDDNSGVFKPQHNVAVAMSHVWLTTGEVTDIIEFVLTVNVNTSVGRDIALTKITSLTRSRNHLTRHNYMSDHHKYVSMTYGVFLEPYLAILKFLNLPKEIDIDVYKDAMNNYFDCLSNILKFLNTNSFTRLQLINEFSLFWVSS